MVKGWFILSDFLFEWDVKKNTLNYKKHGVTFLEASTVFDDENYILKHDDEHAEGDEDRYKAIGFSSDPRLLLVCHCYRMDDTVIRIISARRATAAERSEYNGGQ